MTPGQAFRQLRAAAGLSGVDVARRLRVQPAMVCSVEAGRRPLPKTFVAFARSIAGKAVGNTCKAVEVLGGARQ